jgi:hypothetical protein
VARAYLIQNPYHPYAQRIVRYLWAHHGLKAICVYTNPKERFWLEPEHPLDESAILEQHEITGDELESFARWAAGEHEVVTALPWVEKCHEQAVRMMRAMDLQGWNDLDRVALFRDKQALKAFLAEAAPQIRLNHSRIVRAPEEVWRDPPSEKVVLKPNNGYAQQGVRILDVDDRGAIARFFRERRGPALLEEYVGGRELAVNGQVDERGHAEAWSVVEYVRETVDAPLHDGARTVHPDDPDFALAVEYAAAVIRATGLRRSPYHLELMVDERGPCLIECAARPLGMGAALRYDALHGPRFSALDQAAHYWVSEAPWGDPDLDWDRYGRLRSRDVFGGSRQDARVYAVEGAEDVEGLPDFCRWVKRPEAGARIEEHESLFSLAWAVQLVGEDVDRLEAQAAQVRERLSLKTSAGAVTRASVEAKSLADRVMKRARWEVRRAGRGGT